MYNYSYANAMDATTCQYPEALLFLIWGAKKVTVANQTCVPYKRC